MPTAYLPDRGVIRVSGEDALPWLHNIVTCDMLGLTQGEARYGALLTPQGKILFDFITSFGRISALQTDDAVYLETAKAVAPDFAKRLGLYKLRAKVTVEDFSGDRIEGEPIGVAVAWGEDRVYQADALTVTDPRHSSLGERMLTWEHDALAIESDTAPEPFLAWHAHRIALGIPEGGKDFAFGETFPHEALLDMFGGVDFKKGCYVGQEVVSRMQHRGTARTRIVPVRFEGAAPAAGTEVRAGDRVVGTIGSSTGVAGLAMLRLDRVEEALAAGETLIAGGTNLSLSKPDWWTVAWPDAATPPVL